MKKSTLAGLLVSVFGVFLMSHNVGAATRLGNYTNYVSGGISGLPINWQYNRDTNITATGNSSSYVANGQFGWNLDWQEGQEYVLTLSVSLNSSASNTIVGVLNPEPMNIQGNLYHSTSDTMSMSKSCPSGTNCKTVLMHEIKIIATGSGLESIKTLNSNLVNMSDFVSSNSGSAIISWTGMRFDSYDEWASFRSSAMAELEDQTDLLQNIYDRLDVLDNNADKNAEAWDNMQNTDGLIDVGENQSFLDSFNAFNSFLGGLKNKVADDCVIDGDLGHINLGDVDLCNMPSNVRAIIATISGVVFAVLDLFIVWSSIKYVVAIIDWARRN